MGIFYIFASIKKWHFQCSGLGMMEPRPTFSTLRSSLNVMEAEITLINIKLTSIFNEIFGLGVSRYLSRLPPTIQNNYGNESWRR